MFPAVCAQVLGILPSCTGEGGHCAAKCRKPAPDHQWFPRIYLLFSKNNKWFSGNNKWFFENNKCFSENNRWFRRIYLLFFKNNKLFSRNNR